MPVFNEAATLARVAEVVLARPEVGELVVVDDASSDGMCIGIRELVGARPGRGMLVKRLGAHTDE